MRASMKAPSIRISFGPERSRPAGIRIVGSLRMDKHPLIDHPVWSPRGALVMRPTAGQSIRLTAGSAFRTPAMFETYVQYLLPTPVTAVGALGFGSTNSTQVFGTPPLKPERIVSVETGYQYQDSDYFSFEISAYYNRVTDIIALSNQSTAFTLAQYGDPNLSAITAFNNPTNQFPFGASRLGNDADQYNVFGAEIGGRVFPVDGLDIYANYSPNQTFAKVPGQSGWQRDERTSQHQFNLGVQYRSRFGLDVAADFHYYSRQVWPELQVTAAAFSSRARFLTELVLEPPGSTGDLAGDVIGEAGGTACASVSVAGGVGIAAGLLGMLSRRRAGR